MSTGKNNLLYSCIKKAKAIVKKLPPVQYAREYKILSGSSVLMLHRCEEYDTTKLLPNEILKVSPQYLEQFIQKASKTHTFISLDDLSAPLPEKPFMVFTFDDGYKDNLKKALPVFEKYGVPFTVYVTTCFPDYTANLWWFVLDDIISSNSVIKTSDGVVWDCTTKQRKIDVYMALREIILKFPADDFENKFTEYFSGYKINLKEKAKELALSWDEVKQLAESPLCTIGAQTTNHVNLAEMDDDAAYQEILQSKQQLEEKTGKQVSHFAFPFGTANEVTEREYRLAQKAGFKTAVVSFGGNITDLSEKTLFKIPRKMLVDVYHEF